MPPSCRKGAMMVEPSTKDELQTSFVVGGLTNQNTFDAIVWALNEETGWLPMKTVSNNVPKPRWKGTFSRIDDENSILFGGSENENEYFDDVWILKQMSNNRASQTKSSADSDLTVGGEWKQVTTKGKKPVKRRAHSAVVVAQKYLVLFGGKSGVTKLPLKDLWTLDLTDWSWVDKTNIEFPSEPVKGHSAVVLGNEMFVFGGRSSNTQYYDELMALTFDKDGEPVSWRQVKLASGSKRPSNRNHHVAAALDDTRMLVYGGRSGHDPSFPLLTDTWIFDKATTEWKEIKPTPDARFPTFLGYPKPRIESANAAITSKNIVRIAGGRDSQGHVLNDAWSIEVNKNSAVWRSLAPLDCAGDSISTSIELVSLGFFIGIGALLAAFLWFRYRINNRRAPYEPIGSGSENKNSAAGFA